MKPFEGFETFLVVTFAWSLVVAAFCVKKFFGCKHDWEPVVERELPSKAEVLQKAGENIATGWTTGKLIKIASKIFFAIISCKKCGAVKEFKVKT